MKSSSSAGIAAARHLHDAGRDVLGGLGRRAQVLAALQQQRGAAAANRTLYDRFLAQWNEG